MTTTTTTRRGLLARLGVAAALAGGAGANAVAIVATRPAAAAVPTAPLASPPVSPAEDPRLIALGEEFDRLAAAWDAAERRYHEARTAAERLAPELPAELHYVRPMPPHLKRGGRYMRDVEGKEIAWTESMDASGERVVHRPPMVLMADRLRDDCLPYYGAHTRRAKDIRRRLAVAEHYEAGVAAAAEAAGVKDAADDRRQAGYYLEAKACEIGRTVPTTLEGLLIHARALATFDRVDRIEHPEYSKAGGFLGGNLAAAVLRIAGRTA